MFFPIWIFVVSGYEHCVANMYFIPMAIFSLDKQECVDAAMARYGLTAEQLEQINFENFFFTNLLPVTLGNVVGGVLCVGLVYWLVYVRENKEK
jgi:formate/nitrite transporter FocA (FNT family)